MTARPDVLQKIALSHCPDHRLAMVRWTRTPRAEAALALWWSEVNRPGARRDLSHHIAAGQLWWVAGDMQLLVEAATTSVPDFRLMPGDVPDPQGVVFYEEPLSGIESNSDVTAFSGELALNAMSWSAMNQRPDGTGQLHIYSWVNVRSGPRPGWNCIGVTAWQLGTAISSVREDYEQSHVDSVIEDRRRMAALWLLASQERLAKRQVEPIDKPAGKRHLRAGLEIPTLRVLRLRHTRTDRPDAEPGEARDWTHRWVVSGHWRNQWLPSEERHRPTWIAPYIKGPDDKPLVVKDTVKALVQ